MATREEIAQYFPEGAPNPVTPEGSFAANLLRSGVTDLAIPLQKYAQITANPELAQSLGQIRQSMATNEPGDVLPTNPDLDTSFSTGVAKGLGAAAVDVPLSLLPGGLPIVLGKGALATQLQTEEAQQAYDQASPEEQAQMGPRPSMGAEQLKSAAIQALLMGTGRAVEPFTNSLLAAAKPALRPALGIAAHTGANLLGDVGGRVAFNALEGKDLTPFANPAEFGQSLTGAAAFATPGGLAQASHIPEFLRLRAEKQAQDALAKAKSQLDANLAAADQRDTDAKYAKYQADEAAKAKVVLPTTPPPEPTTVKPATETETGTAVTPDKIVPPLNPTAALPPELTLQPGTAQLAADSSTKPAQVITTPKLEPTPESEKTEEKSSTPPQVEAPIPENEHTLFLQQEQLKDKTNPRQAMLFTSGEKELPLCPRVWRVWKQIQGSTITILIRLLLKRLKHWMMLIDRTFSLTLVLKTRKMSSRLRVLLRR